MKSYKELTKIVEDRLDEMMKNPEEALKNDISSVMDILLDTLCLSPDNPDDNDRFVGEDIADKAEQRRIVEKVVILSGELLDKALTMTVGRGMNEGRFILYTYQRCREWLKKHPIPTSEIK